MKMKLLWGMNSKSWNEDGTIENIEYGYQHSHFVYYQYSHFIGDSIDKDNITPICNLYLDGNRNRINYKKINLNRIDLSTIEFLSSEMRSKFHIPERVFKGECFRGELNNKSFDIILDDNEIVVSIPENYSIYLLHDMDRDKPLHILYPDYISNEFRYDIKNDLLSVIDYENHEYYTLRNDNCKTVCYELRQDKVNGFQYSKVDFNGKLINYHYDKYGILKSIADDDRINYLRIEDEYDGEKEIDVSYRIPFVKGINEIINYGKDYRIYRHDHVKIIKDKVISWTLEYNIYNDSAEQQFLNSIDQYTKEYNQSI